MPKKTDKCLNIRGIYWSNARQCYRVVYHLGAKLAYLGAFKDAASAKQALAEKQKWLASQN